MSSNIMNEDLRSIKTKKALFAAMFSLLKTSNFKKITIKEICEEALISRATFYAHFYDKYDLLQHWMPELMPKDIYANSSYEQMEKAVNCYVNENMTLIKNLIYEADTETYNILYSFILKDVNLAMQRESDTFQKSIVFSNFYAGGILSYLSWQINNKFPADVPIMNKHFNRILHDLRKWQKDNTITGGDL